MPYVSNFYMGMLTKRNEALILWSMAIIDMPTEKAHLMPAIKIKLTEAQRKALVSARDHGDPTYHLRGRSAYGGFDGTWRVLVRNGLLTESSAITEAGRNALRDI